MGHLNELLEKYENKGFRIVAISSEPLSKIDAVMVQGKGGKFWMGSDPSRDTIGPFGGGGIPHAYLVDAMGKVAWSGHPGSLKDAQVEKLLAQAFDPKLDRELHPSLKSLVKLYTKGQIGKAHAGAAKYTAHEDRVVSSDAVYLRERCDAVAAFKKKVTEEAIKEKDYATADEILKQLPKDFAGMEVATWAKETAAKLDADEAVKTERKAWKAYEKAGARERKADGKAKKLKPVLTAYERLAKKYPGTRAADFATQAAARLGKVVR